ncbi:hypothetical protein ACFSHQ_17470 [Gemmobacter lanyuensis]
MSKGAMRRVTSANASEGGASGFSVTMIQPCHISQRMAGRPSASLQKLSFNVIAGAPRSEPSRL